MSAFHFQVAVSGSPPSSCRISHFNISEDATISAGNLGRGMRLFEFLKGKGAASLGWAQSNATIDYDYNRLHMYTVYMNTCQCADMLGTLWSTLYSAYTFTWLYSDILCMAIHCWTDLNRIPLCWLRPCSTTRVGINHFCQSRWWKGKPSYESFAVCNAEGMTHG